MFCYIKNKEGDLVLYKFDKIEIKKDETIIIKAKNETNEIELYFDLEELKI